MKAYRVIKQNSEEGDANQNGAKGYIIAELNAPPQTINNITVNKMYLIYWDNYPDNLVFTIDLKVKQLHNQLIDIELTEQAKEYLEIGLPDQIKNILKFY